MVNEVVEDAQLAGRLSDLAAEAASTATVAVGLARTLVNRNLRVGLRDAMASEGMAVELSLRSQDFKEGMAAFREKRSPDFQGR